MGVRTRPDSDDGFPDTEWVPVVEPPLAAAAAVAAVVLVVLLLNGRAVTVVPGGPDPGWLTALVARPFYVLAREVAALDETSRGLIGKLVSSILAAVSAAVLFVTVARRRTEREGALTALVFALGTTVWSTSGDLQPYALGTLGIAVALLFLSRGEDNPRWAGRAGLPLVLAVAAHPATAAMASVMALVACLRWPRRIPFLLAWSLPALVLAQVVGPGIGPVDGGAGASWGTGHLALLFSPARGLFVFTPAVIIGIVGLVRSWSEGERAMAVAAGGGAVAHWLFVGSRADWYGPPGWGPITMTEALPALLLFLPQGLAVTRMLGPLLLALSVGVQVLGAFSYDGRWDRLHPRAASDPGLLWDPARSPVVFTARERVVRLSLPTLSEGLLVRSEHPLVLGKSRGSQIHFGRDEMFVDGAPATMTDVHLEGTARIEGDTLHLDGPAAGVFLRVVPEARHAPHILHVEVVGDGTLAVSEGSFWTLYPRLTRHRVRGVVHIQERYFYPESGGGDIRVSAAGPGRLSVRSVRFLSAASIAPPPAR